MDGPTSEHGREHAFGFRGTSLPTSLEGKFKADNSGDELCGNMTSGCVDAACRVYKGWKCTFLTIDAWERILIAFPACDFMYFSLIMPRVGEACF